MKSKATNKIIRPQSWLERRINIIQIGAGGNGSETFDGLTRIHKAMIANGHPWGLHVTLIDDDLVEEPNLVRQRFWPNEIGQNKAKCLVERANLFEGMDWDYVGSRFPIKFGGPNNFSDDIDLLISCTDNYKCRRDIYELYKGANTQALWLDMGNGRTTGQVILGHLSSHFKDRVNNVVDIYPDILTSKEKVDAPSCSAAESLVTQDLFINPKVAMSACNMLWNLLRDGALEKNCIYVDVVSMSETASI